MPGSRHLTTAILLQHVASGVEIAYPFPGTPRAVLRIEGAIPRLTLRVESSAAPPSSVNAMKNLKVASVTNGGKQFLTVSVTGEEILLDGHAMLCAIADRVQLEQLTPRDAILETVAQWRAVLAARTRLSPEAEVGVFGELLVLDAVRKIYGDAGLDSWRATAGEEHDFGLPDLDVEVKTTASERRTHWISGLRQMVPTNNRPLVVLSLQVTRGGSVGRTLPQLIRDVRTNIGDALRFDEKLALVGWDPADADLYPDRWSLRGRPACFSVAGDFPRLTPDLVARLPVEDAQIVEIHYRIDLEHRDDDATPHPGLAEVVKELRNEGDAQ